MVTIWILYKKPVDFPESYVVRRAYIQQGGISFDPMVTFAEQVSDEARAKLDRDYQGKLWVPRTPADEPQIEGFWC